MIRLLPVVAVVLLAASLLYRFIYLGSVPGINADELYTIVQINLARTGHSYSFRTLGHQFLDPIMLGIEWLVALSGTRSFFLFRLPAAMVGCLTLAVFFLLYRRTYRNGTQALMATALLGCMPMAIADSRINWDPTYVPLAACFLVFVALRAAENRMRRLDWIWLAIWVPLGLWIHAMVAHELVALLAAVCWVRGPEVISRARRPRVAAALTCAAVILTAAGVFFGLTRLTANPINDVLHNILARQMVFLRSPARAVHYLSRVGDALSGVSTYEDFSGMTHPSLWLRGMSVLVLAAILLAVWRLFRSPDPADRALAAFWVAVGPLLLASASLLNLDRVGIERYAVWLLPPAAALLVRAAESWGQRLRQRPGFLAAIVAVSLCAIFIGQFPIDYLAAARNMTYRDTTSPAYWTGPVEPKGRVADLIAQQAAGQTKLKMVYCENFWLKYPLMYRLGPDFDVKMSILTEPFHDRKAFYVGFAGSSFLSRARSKLIAAGVWFDQTAVPGGDGRPAIILLTSYPAATSRP